MHAVRFQRYFHQTHSIVLKHPRMFGIVTGSRQRKVVYPAEVCTVEAGQFYRKRVPAEFTKSVVDFATKNPQDRISTINRGMGLGQQGGLEAPVSHTRSSTMQPGLTAIGPRISKFTIYQSCRDDSIADTAGY